METLFGFDDLAPRDSGDADVPAPTPISRDRDSVIAQIIAANPTATAAFLNQFTDEQLWLYLSLQWLKNSPWKEKRSHGW